MCLVGLSPPMNDHPTSQTRSLDLRLTGIGGGRQQFVVVSTLGCRSRRSECSVRWVLAKSVESRSLDQIQQIWFIEWAYYALAHGHNPFFTQLQNYPVGINLGVNTSMLGLGGNFSPITSAFGPVVTWNVLMRLALFLSASSMCLVLRRWTSWWPAAFIGGLLYGFRRVSTFYTYGYLFLVFVPLPPVILLPLPRS